MISARALIMRYYLIVVILISALLLVSIATAEDGVPLKYLSSCQIDLNNDNELDIALLIETVRGNELLVLIKTPTGYNSYVVSRDKPNMNLSCHYGKTVTETAAGKARDAARKSYTTPGAYVRLKQPEGASVVYFWNGKGFTEVWTSD